MTVRESARLEKEVPLRVLYPLAGYAPHEKARPDKFKNAYTGKVHRGLLPGSITATEVVSMGLEYLQDNPLQFAQEDRDYFDFIWDLLRSGK